MEQPVLETTLLIIFLVLFVNLIFRAIHLPVILGYLVAGTALGPHGLGIVTSIDAIKYFSEFGVVLLMFTIGLEFSLSKLITLKFPVFVFGGIQVVGTIALTVLIGLLFNMPFTSSLTIGCVVSMSSTALVVKQLSQQYELHSRHGLNAVAVLLFQDLAVVPIFIILTSLSTMQDQSIFHTLWWSLLRGILAILVIILVGRWLLKPLFRLIAAIRTVELFTLAVLFVALGSAWVTESLGMTYALGAFLSGIMLGETEFRQNIKEEIRPFKDVLLGLFFVSVGMLADVNTWAFTWYWIALTLFAIVLGKFLLIMLICRFSQHDLECSVRSGIILAQGGEFGFAILAFALDNHLLSVAYGQVVLAALVISFACAPVIIHHNEALAKWITKNHST